MRASSILVHRFTLANRLTLERYRSGNGRSLGPLEKPIAERTVSLKSDLTSLRDRLFRCRLVRGDQEHEPVQKISLITEAGHDFSCRCTIENIRSRCPRTKPVHHSSSFWCPIAKQFACQYCSRYLIERNCLVERMNSADLPLCGHCPHADRGGRVTEPMERK